MECDGTWVETEQTEVLFGRLGDQLGVGVGRFVALAATSPLFGVVAVRGVVGGIVVVVPTHFVVGPSVHF